MTSPVTDSTSPDVEDAISAFARVHFDDLTALGDGCGELAERISAWMVDHGVVFADQPIPFVMAPHALDLETMARVRHVVEVLTRILDRFCTAFRSDAELRHALDLSTAESDLVQIEPTLDDPLQLCRLDAFLLPDGSLQFLEFNAESPAGIGYTDVMFNGLHEHFHSLQSPDTGFTATYERITDHLIATVRDVEARWRTWTTSDEGPGRALGIPEQVERPRVVLVDTADSPSVPEFKIICRELEAAGFDASWASLDQLTRVGGRLHAHGAPIDVVYRRALVEDVLDPLASPGASALIATVRAGAVAMLNPFPARVANNKKLLALLGAPEFAHLLLDDEERRVVRESIPWTRVLASGSTSLPDGSAGDLPSYICAHREELVLKPASDYGGHNVYLGRNTDPDQWAAIVLAHAGTNDWIVQQLVEVPVGRFPAIENGRLVVRDRYFNINPFAIGGRYAGMITRISTEQVINVSAGGGLLPCIAVERR
ncbi:MAG: circularly permuted type 2 ATP-grasp protein [Gaiellales bacterium]